MLRRLLVVGTVAALAGSATAELSACGDKFLRAGRSQRTRGYAAIHPSSILIYKPTATVKGLKDFEGLLRKAGHKPTALRDPAALAEVLAASKYDLVIADYEDTTLVKSRFSRASGEPALLPILEKPTKALSDEVARHYHCVLKIGDITQYDALDEIDHLMGLRRKAAAREAAQ